MESRTTAGPATLSRHDAVLGILWGAGFSLVLAAHASFVLDSFIYGFELQEMNLPSTTLGTTKMAQVILARLATQDYPHLAALTVEHVLRPGYDHTRHPMGKFDLRDQPASESGIALLASATRSKRSTMSSAWGSASGPRGFGRLRCPSRCG